MKDFWVSPQGWFVVCDGAKALFLHNVGDAERPCLTAFRVLERPAPPTHALGTDRPGRVHESHDARRSAVSQTDWHAQEETAFLKEVLRQLEDLAREQPSHPIALVAPPRALGILRQHLPAALKPRIRAEIAKDLVGLPPAEIERHLLS